MKILCTFSGRFGDILWSLPTVRQISKNHGVKVDFGIMPSYKSLLPLLKAQSYISSAFTIDNWFCQGSPWGDQPWEAPLDMLEPYEKVFHLAYRNHPWGNNPLVDFTAKQQGLILDEPVVPFIDTKDFPPYPQTYIAYAFNEAYKPEKDKFLECLRLHLAIKAMSGPQIEFFDISKSEWSWARYGMKHALAFVGCRSGNHVLAHGVGQKHIVIYEPHPAINGKGQFGSTFTNPHWPDYELPLTLPPEQCAELAAKYIKDVYVEKVTGELVSK